MFKESKFNPNFDPDISIESKLGQFSVLLNVNTLEYYGLVNFTEVSAGKFIYQELHTPSVPFNVVNLSLSAKNYPP
jgi:hypothetical protein